ncbi:MAG: hypothetical protein UT69_C0037G0012 [Candidatus Yanofskybacteria bacterium GW2011_GWE1_40_10]|nr:MAG: hypothetical protein UT69_C0037G0012 [Candidatus Yanofskybacteria bacterium GW2011_GWE1_40_10]
MKLFRHQWELIIKALVFYASHPDHKVERRECDVIINEIESNI